jgi:hypothetical protein
MPFACMSAIWAPLPGLRTNENAQVLGEDGAPIDRLYAVGNDCRFDHGRQLPGRGHHAGPRDHFWLHRRPAHVRRQRVSLTISGAGAKAAAPNGATIRPGTKQALLVDLLPGRNGATVAEIQDATGWQPHTARAALIGLRKKSFAVRSTTRDDGSRAYLLPPPEHRRGERLGAGPTVFMAKARPDILNRG